MNVARWRIAARGLGQALAKGGQNCLTFAPVCLQVIVLFDSAVSFDDQHILEKFSASCVRCTHVRLSAARVQRAHFRASCLPYAHGAVDALEPQNSRGQCARWTCLLAKPPVVLSPVG